MFLSNRYMSGVVAVCAVALLGAPVPAQARDEGHGWHLSIGAEKSAEARDVGMPIYPGARVHKDDEHGGDSAARVWALAGAFGFKVAVMEMESSDPPERIAAFYRPVLAKYGQVLDCSTGVRHDRHGHDGFRCDDDNPKPGELQFKAGTETNQYIVDVKPRHGGGSTFALVFVELRGFGD